MRRGEGKVERYTPVTQICEVAERVLRSLCITMRRLVSKDGKSNCECIEADEGA